VSAVCPSAEFLLGEQGQGFRVEKDRVIGNPGLGESAGEFGPDLVVASPVFGLEAGFELHLEGCALHQRISLSLKMVVGRYHWATDRGEDLIFVRASASFNRSAGMLPHCAKLNDTGGPARKKLMQVVAPERMTGDASSQRAERRRSRRACHLTQLDRGRGRVSMRLRILRASQCYFLLPGAIAKQPNFR
jgi:hypothetical protein